MPMTAPAKNRINPAAGCRGSDHGHNNSNSSPNCSTTSAAPFLACMHFPFHEKACCRHVHFLTPRKQWIVSIKHKAENPSLPELLVRMPSQISRCNIDHNAGQILRRVAMNKDQIKGVINDAAGKVQQQANKMTGNKKQQTKGLSKQAAGKIQKNNNNTKETKQKAGKKH